MDDKMDTFTKEFGCILKDQMEILELKCAVNEKK